MDVFAKRWNNYTGIVISPGDCEASWAKDRKEGDAATVREASGLGAVVTYRSKNSLKKAVGKCDTYLLNELDYARQYDPREADREHLAYLWVDHTGPDHTGRLAVLGACCFRKRHYKDSQDHPYAMQWVWLHSCARRQGHLSRAWPYFEKRFGLFLVEGPYSDAMARYLVHKTRYNEMLVKLGGHPLRITADTDVSQRFWDTTAKAVMS